jgi:hypothetical protein
LHGLDRRTRNFVEHGSFIRPPVLVEQRSGECFRPATQHRRITRYDGTPSHPGRTYCERDFVFTLYDGSRSAKHGGWRGSIQARSPYNGGPITLNGRWRPFVQFFLTRDCSVSGRKHGPTRLTNCRFHDRTPVPSDPAANLVVSVVDCINRAGQPPPRPQLGFGENRFRRS